MVESDGGSAFPVVFFDGEREMLVGDVVINPNMEYKTFQIMLSQMIGISPNQISTYLVDSKRNPISSFSDSRRRIPVTGKVNFSLICRQKDCYFLVVLKRSRKLRNRRERAINAIEFGDFLLEDVIYSPPTPLLLRRDKQHPFYDHISEMDLDDLNEQLQSLRFQKENYQLAMAGRDLTSGHGLDPLIPNLSINSVSMVDDWQRTPKNKMERVNCDECAEEEKNGERTSFHPCANDTVFNGFATRLGPINRPM